MNIGEQKLFGKLMVILLSGITLLVLSGCDRSTPEQKAKKQALLKKLQSYQKKMTVYLSHDKVILRGYSDAYILGLVNHPEFTGKNCGSDKGYKKCRERAKEIVKHLYSIVENKKDVKRIVFTAASNKKAFGIINKKFSMSHNFSRESFAP
jgi:hypothetical protein